MYRIGIVGIESKHADYFGDIFNIQKLFSGYRIYALWCGDDASKTTQLSNNIEVSKVYDTVDELIDSVDAVMILHRRGSDHFDAAMKAICAGKPVFVDKPFTTDTTQAAELINAAKRNNVPLMGGSTLKFLPEVKAIQAKLLEEEVDTVLIRYQADEHSIYEGLWFYGSHLSELCLVLAGLDFSQVKAVRNNQGIAATVEYANKKVMINTSSQHTGLHTITMGKTVNHYSIEEKDCYMHGMQAFVSMLQTNKPPIAYDFYVQSVKLMDGIIKSLNQN